MTMTDSPDGSGGETFASIADAARAYSQPEEIETPEEVTPPDTPEPVVDEEAETVESDETNADEDDDLTLDEEDDAPPAETEESFAPAEAKVKLEDGKVVTVADLIKNGLFQETFTRKTQALAEDKKAFEASVNERIGQREAEIAQERAALLSVASALLPKEPDRAMLDPNSPNYDPFGFQQAKLQFEDQMQALRGVDAKHRETLAKRQEADQKAYNERVAAEKALLHEKAPEFADPAKFQAFWNEAVEAGQVYGYSEEDLSQITSHSSYLVMRDALAYRRIKAKHAAAKAKGEGKPPVLSGGKRKNAAETQRRGANDAMERLNKTGSLRDGVAALLALEKG